MKNIFIKRAAIYALSAALAAFYVLVLWCGKNPRVGIEYKMYYITHELSDWPGYGKLSYTLGTVEYCTGLYDEAGYEVGYTVCQRKGQGWYAPKNTGCLMREQSASLYYVPDSSAQNVQLSLTVSQFDGGGSVEVYADGELIGSISQKGEVHFIVPSVKQNELLTIRFEADGQLFRLYKASLG